MKKLLVAVLALAMSSVLLAQDNYFSLNMGLAIPLESFGKLEDVTTDGYALNGFSLNFDGAYFPWANLGFGGMLSFTSNYGETEDFQLGMNEFYNQSGILTYAVPDYAERDLKSGFWNTVMVLAGPTLNLPLNRLHFDLRVLGGGGMVITPTREYQLSYDFTELNSETGKNSVHVAYLVGGGLKFEMSQGYAVKLNADYLVTHTKYDIRTDMTVSSNVEDFPDQEVDLKIPLFTVSLGLCYLF